MPTPAASGAAGATPNPDLDRIHLAEFRFLECAVTERNPVVAAEQTTTLKISTELSFDVPSQRLTVRFEMLITCHPNAAPTSITADARINLVFAFLVEELERYLIPVDTRPDPVPSPMLSLTIAGVAYSTARGLVLAKLANTALEGYALPLQDARNLILSPQKKAALPKRRATR